MDYIKLVAALRKYRDQDIMERSHLQEDKIWYGLPTTIYTILRKKILWIRSRDGQHFDISEAEIKLDKDDIDYFLNKYSALAEEQKYRKARAEAFDKMKAAEKACEDFEKYKLVIEKLDKSKFNG